MFLHRQASYSVIRVISVAAFILITAGCNLKPSEPSPTADPGLSLDNLGDIPFEQYATDFTLAFEADPGWQYRLRTRRSAGILERQLRIEGVEDSRNPGEVRMVTQGGITRIRGEGTEDRCLQFPAEMNINVTVLTPDDILPPEAIREPFVLLGHESVSGFDSAHYVLNQAELDGWQQVQIGLWVSMAADMVVQQELEALGWDPYFGAGWGQLSGRYQLAEVGQQMIEPIQGCQVELPLPADADDLVILPEVIAFGSSQSVRELADFYFDELDQAGWRSLEREESGSGAVVMRFLRDGERLKVTLRRFNEVTQVALLEE